MSGICHSGKSRLVIPVLCALALAIFAAGCGGSEDSESSTTAAATAKSAESGSTEAVMKPVDGSNASGTIIFRKKANGATPLKVRLAGLEQLSGDRQYVVWLVGSRHDMLSLATYYGDKNGRIDAHMTPTPAKLLPVEYGTKTELLVTKVQNNDLFVKGIYEAEDPYDPPLIGKPILRGTLTGPLAG
jgi:hypothetical protein